MKRGPQGKRIDPNKTGKVKTSRLPRTGGKVGLAKRVAAAGKKPGRYLAP